MIIMVIACLFRVISFLASYGHLQLRNLAVYITLPGNVSLFQDYFLEDGGTVDDQINLLSQLTKIPCRSGVNLSFVYGIRSNSH